MNAKTHAFLIKFIESPKTAPKGLFLPRTAQGSLLSSEGVIAVVCARPPPQWKCAPR